MTSELVKIFLLWLVLFFSIFFSLFWGSEGDIPTKIFGTLVLAVPISIVAMFIHKWIIEAQLKRSEMWSASDSNDNGDKTKHIKKLSAKSSDSLTKFVGIILLVILSAFVSLSISFVFALYYLIRTSVALFGKKVFSMHFPWYAGATVHGILLYLILPYIYHLLYGLSVLINGTYSSSGLVIFLSLDAYIAFFGSVLLYEWHRNWKDYEASELTPNAENKNENSETPVLVWLPWFVLAPNIIRFALFGISSIGGNSEAMGFAILNLMLSAPFGFIFPITWILWREKKWILRKTENGWVFFPRAEGSLLP